MPRKSSSKSASKSKSTVSASTSQSVAAAPAPTSTPAPVVESTPVPITTDTQAATQASSTAITYATLETEFSNIQTRLSELRSLESSILADVRKLQKSTMRYVKDINRKNKKRKSNIPDGEKKKRAPSGFAKPALISSQLCAFLGKPEGTEMARTEVTKYLTNYIKTHNLQDQSNRRKIIPDKKLQSLLNVNKSDEVTYFNLQKYMKVHFPPNKSASVSTSA